MRCRFAPTSQYARTELRLTQQGPDARVTALETGFERVSLDDAARRTLVVERLEFWKRALGKLAWGAHAPQPEDDPLTNALFDGDFAEAQRLVDAGVDVNRFLFDGSTALMWAFRTDEDEEPSAAVERVRWLVKAGARVPGRGVLSFFKPKQGASIVHTAAERGDMEILGLLLEADGLWTLHVFDDLQRTPLISAADKGHLAAVKLLLKAGSDIDAHDDQNIGETALNRAVQSRHEEVVEYLLERGADPTIKGWMRLDAVDQAEDLDPPNPRILAMVKAAAEKRRRS